MWEAAPFTQTLRARDDICSSSWSSSAWWARRSAGTRSVWCCLWALRHHSCASRISSDTRQSDPTPQRHRRACFVLSELEMMSMKMAKASAPSPASLTLPPASQRDPWANHQQDGSALWSCCSRASDEDVLQNFTMASFTIKSGRFTHVFIIFLRASSVFFFFISLHILRSILLLRSETYKKWDWWNICDTSEPGGLCRIHL